MSKFWPPFDITAIVALFSFLFTFPYNNRTAASVSRMKITLLSKTTRGVFELWDFCKITAGNSIAYWTISAKQIVQIHSRVSTMVSFFCRHCYISQK